MLKKIKWIVLYLIFFILTFFLVTVSVGFSYYFSGILNTKIEAHWWIAIMQYGDLNSIEYFVYNYQQRIFFTLYLIFVISFSILVYKVEKKGFWLFILSVLVFVFTCFIGEMAIFKNLNSLNITSEEQFKEAEIASFINQTVWFIRWYIYFTLFKNLLSTIGYFRKKDYLNFEKLKNNNEKT